MPTKARTAAKYTRMAGGYNSNGKKQFAVRVKPETYTALKTVALLEKCSIQEAAKLILEIWLAEKALSLEYKLSNNPHLKDYLP